MAPDCGGGRSRSATILSPDDAWQSSRSSFRPHPPSPGQAQPGHCLDLQGSCVLQWWPRRPLSCRPKPPAARFTPAVPSPVSQTPSRVPCSRHTGAPPRVSRAPLLPPASHLPRTSQASSNPRTDLSYNQITLTQPQLARHNSRPSSPPTEASPSHHCPQCGRTQTRNRQSLPFPLPGCLRLHGDEPSVMVWPKSTEWRSCDFNPSPSLKVPDKATLLPMGVGMLSEEMAPRCWSSVWWAWDVQGATGPVPVSDQRGPRQ